ncbi:MAG: YHYH domain-containing protein [Cellvibrio sp.]|uniref:peptidoglycan-binding protein n=1 Tax=Cellvibrio sp. TaxID=1965322 RepID=UPI002719D4B0|nr:YHYH domain-containing protein [Cellvibrio sp.]
MDINKALLLCLLLIPSFVSAHGGRTDKYGCHNDRKNGGYHCHNGGSVPKPQSIRTSDNATRTTSAKPQELTAQPASSQVREANLAAYKDLVLKTQLALNQLGYSAGEPDGVLGKQTVKAIKHFQVDSDMAVDGKPSYLLLEVLLGRVG